MNTYQLQYLPTGRLVLDKDNTPVTVQANTERGAKCQFTKARHYVNWDLHAVRLKGDK